MEQFNPGIHAHLVELGFNYSRVPSNGCDPEYDEYATDSFYFCFDSAGHYID